MLLLHNTSIICSYLAHFSAQAPKIKKIHPRKFLYSKEDFSYISGNGNHKKVLYISGNGTFLYFGKGIFRTLVYSEP